MCLQAAALWRAQSADIKSDSPFRIAHLVWLFRKPKVHISLINLSVAKNSFSNICQSEASLGSLVDTRIWAK